MIGFELLDRVKATLIEGQPFLLVSQIFVLIFIPKPISAIFYQLEMSVFNASVELSEIKSIRNKHFEFTACPLFTHLKYQIQEIQLKTKIEIIINAHNKR